MQCYTVPTSLTTSLGVGQHTPRCAHAARPQHCQALSAVSNIKAHNINNELQLSALSGWIKSHGGYVHPALQLVECAQQSQCRGVVAAHIITIEDLEAGPIVSVPQELQFTSERALHIIQQHAGPETAVAAADKLSNSQLIAAALAHQIKNISSSWWHPYLLTLPQHPPNPWLLSDEQAAACIQLYCAARGAEAVAGWAAATASYRFDKLQEAEQVFQLLGTPLGISQQEVLTGLAQLLSRGLTRGSSSGLVPCIDLINHGAQARAPMLQLDGNDKLVMTVLPIRNGEAVPMNVGDELLISYQGGYTPLEAFLKFGFVADEWW